MLNLDGQKTSCCYQLCTPSGGHSVCTVVQDHYERLCKAADLLCSSAEASGTHQGPAARLREVLSETTGVDR